MSEITWTQLRDLDCEAMRTLGESWKSYAGRMAEQSQRLRDEVIKGHLSVDNYESDTADQVREQISLTADRFEDDLSDYATIRLSTTLFEAAEDLEAEQTELEELTQLLDSRGMEITGDPANYTVTVTEELINKIESLDWPDWLQAEVDRSALGPRTEGPEQLVEPLKLVAEDFAGQYQEWLRAVMSRAHDADDDAASALSTMQEQAPDLPPRFGETYEAQLEDYKQELSDEVGSEMEAVANGESGMSPEQVNQWWETLSDDERDALISEHPDWVGPTDGIPVDDRDTANRAVLADDIASLDEQIADLELRIAEMEANGEDTEITDGSYYSSGHPQATAEYQALLDELDELKGDRSDLDALQDRITDDEGNPAVYGETGQQYYLLGADTEGEGQAIVSIGDPDTADNVNVYVPGTGADLSGASGSLLGRAETMSFDTSDAAPDQETATVLWLDYDAPDNAMPFQNGAGLGVEAMDSSYAEDAAEGLESFTQGINATSEGDPSNVTLTGHSYGTTVIGTAATTEGVDSDNLMFVASPGVGVDSASALGFGDENVWATRNDSDVIQYTPSSVHGVDPTTEAFGANTIHSDSSSGSANDNHSTYWDDTNKAGRRSMAEAVTGQADTGE